MAEKTFPFNLLVMWIKMTPESLSPCDFCGGQSSFTCEHYVDVLSLRDALRSHVDEGTIQKIVDHSWENALQTQQRGEYSKHADTYHCLSCTADIVKEWSNIEAVVTFLPLITTGDGLSLVFCSHVEKAHAPKGGKAGILPTRSKTVEEVVQHLKINHDQKEGSASSWEG